MKLLRLLSLLALASFTLGCGPGGPPPVMESEDVDPIDDVDMSLEEAAAEEGEDGAGESGDATGGDATGGDDDPIE
ncbi:MAG: hypothetical protein H8E66_14525 [Planctomycetes bacterium]|nr:hypothetical protein [Planctomycetota bacterium]